MRRAVDDMDQTIVMVTHDPGRRQLRRPDRLPRRRPHRRRDAPADRRAGARADEALRGVSGMCCDNDQGPARPQAATGHHGAGRDARRHLHRRHPVLTDTIGRTFDDLFADVYKDTDGVVRAAGRLRGTPTRPATSGAGSRPAWSTRSAPSRAWPSPRAQVFGYARLIGSDGEALGNPADGRPDHRRQLERLPELNAFRLVEGRAPRADDEVVIDRKSALDGDLAVGRHHHRAGPGPTRRRVRITGIAKLRRRRQPRRRQLRALHARRGRSAWWRSPASSTASPSSPRTASPRAELVRRVEAVAARRRRGGHRCRRSPRRPRIEIATGLLSFFNTFMLIFAVDRPARRRLHDLQHVLHHGRPAVAGECAAAGARRHPAPGLRAPCWLRPSWSGILASVAGPGRSAWSWRRASRPCSVAGLRLDLPVGSMVFAAAHGGRLARGRHRA